MRMSREPAKTKTRAPSSTRAEFLQINPGYRVGDRELDLNLRDLVDSVLGGGE